MKIEKFDLDNFESESEWRKEMDRKINDEWSVGDIRNYLLTHIQEGQYSSGGSMAKGGEANDRLYYFMKDDLKKLEKAVSEGDNEEIDRFFSYWSYHLKSLKTKTNDRMF